MRRMPEGVKEFSEWARETVGPSLQLIITMEEMGELTSALSHYIREPDDPLMVANVVEEIADVLFMLEQMISFFEITDEELYDRIQSKLKRAASSVKAMDIVHEHL